VFLSSIINQYKATEKNLKEYAKSIGKADFEFSDINQSFYDGFVDFLQKKSFTINTVGTYIKVLKTFLNDAKTQGYNRNSDYSSFHVFEEEIDNIYLNENELQQLKDTDFSKIPHLALVRDWFLLLAWTGSRFSDLEKISRTDIQDDFISFRQQKTNTKVVIPLHPVVLEILEKYGFNMPAPINNQRFNECIKEVCKIAGLNTKETMTRTVGGKLVTKKFEKWEHTSSHTGRRSFCTNMYKRGLPTLMIMSISGHKTESAFLKYIKVKQHEHAEMMKKKKKNIYK
jgi:integrase